MAQYGTRKTHNGYETGIVSGYVYDQNTGVHYSGSPTHFKEEFSLIGLWTSTRSVYDDVRNYYIHAKDYYGEGEHLYIQKGTGYYIFEGASGEGVRWFGRFPFRPDFQDSNGYWHEKDHGFIWDSDAPIPFYNYGKVSDFERSDGVRYIDPDGNGVFTKKPNPLSFNQFLALYDSDTVITNEDSSEIFLKLNGRKLPAHLAHEEYLKEYNHHDSLIKPEAVLRLIDRYSHHFSKEPLDYDTFLNLFDQSEIINPEDSLAPNLEAEIKINGYQISANLAHEFYLLELKKHPNLSEAETIHEFIGFLAKKYHEHKQQETISRPDHDHIHSDTDSNSNKNPIVELSPTEVNMLPNNSFPINIPGAQPRARTPHNDSSSSNTSNWGEYSTDQDSELQFPLEVHGNTTEDSAYDPNSSQFSFSSEPEAESPVEGAVGGIDPKTSSPKNNYIPLDFDESSPKVDSDIQRNAILRRLSTIEEEHAHSDSSQEEMQDHASSDQTVRQQGARPKQPRFNLEHLEESEDISSENSSFDQNEHLRQGAKPKQPSNSPSVHSDYEADTEYEYFELHSDQMQGYDNPGFELSDEIEPVYNQPEADLSASDVIDYGVDLETTESPVYLINAILLGG